MILNVVLLLVVSGRRKPKIVTCKGRPGVNITDLMYGRVEICRDRHDQRSCKICASCVNFPGKLFFLHNLRRLTKFTHAKCNLTLKLLNFYTFSVIKEKRTQTSDINAFILLNCE